LTLADHYPDAPITALLPALTIVATGEFQSINQLIQTFPPAGLLVLDLEVDTSTVRSSLCSVTGVSVRSLSIKYPTLSKPLNVSIDGLDVQLRQHQIPLVSGKSRRLAAAR
jgi:hypothetical protein